MPTILLTFVALLAAEPAPPTHADNPVYQQVLSLGPLSLPAPTMADGLDAAAQDKVMDELLEGAYSRSEFMRQSVVAPQLKMLRDLDAPARAFDFWFVAYGKLERFEDRRFLEEVWGSGADAEGDGKTLTAADLAERNITIPEARTNHEFYAYFSADILKRVQLEGTVHGCYSRSPDSLIVAVMMDPRFQSDPQYANQWRPKTRDSLGRLQTGAPQPYETMALYLKITELKNAPGALLIECHGVYLEPQGWFDGANLLGSKYPLIVQDRAKAIRQQLLLPPPPPPPQGK